MNGAWEEARFVSHLHAGWLAEAPFQMFIHVLGRTETQKAPQQSRILVFFPPRLIRSLFSVELVLQELTETLVRRRWGICLKILG